MLESSAERSEAANVVETEAGKGESKDDQK